MNIETLNWDPLLVKVFGIFEEMLPEIKSSSEIYGQIKCGSQLDDIPISGVSRFNLYYNSHKLNVSLIDFP